MIPLDFQCGHVNYARWGSVNVAEARLLREEKPEIYNALVDSQGAVYRTARPFSGVWHDMALEQSLNRDCGKHEHLATKDKALTKYYLTAHLKAAVTAMTKQMSGIQSSTSDVHKEATTKRTAADEAAVQAIIKTVTERMVNPFYIEHGTSPDNKQPLMNIATSTVAPLDVTESLCKIRENGSQEMKQFVHVSSRLQSGEVDFFDPIKRNKLKSFANLNKAVTT